MEKLYTYRQITPWRFAIDLFENNKKIATHSGWNYEWITAKLAIEALGYKHVNDYQEPDIKTNYYEYMVYHNYIH